MTIASVNPVNGETIRTYDEMPLREVGSILEKVQSAHESWRYTSFAERADKLRTAGDILRTNAEVYGKIMAEEMGKPLREGIAEAEKCAWVCSYYAEHGEQFLSPRHVETDGSKSYVTFQPLGIVLAVMPWNFPFWQVFRFAAPGLMAGNGAILKHASNVPACALAIEAVFQEAGFPEHLFRTVLIGSARVTEVIEHPLVRGITLTGSTPAGRAVAKAAGTLLKKTVLELGGSDPYVILEDADLESAAQTCATARLTNGGQSCIAAKRFIVPVSIQDRFEELFVAIMTEKKMGDPFAKDIDLGPQAREDLRNELHHQVQRSIELGARLLLGGELPKGPGAFYPPTVLSNVRPGMPAYDDELFGPVAAIVPVKDEADAIRVANDTSFGLGAAVFTRDVDRGEQIAAEELQAGCCFVNDFVRSDPRLPFGGIKDSGYGRELGEFGIHEFVNIKTVYVA